jgi:hypothetical protein
MSLLRLTCVLSLSLLFSVAQQEVQVPTRQPELIAGPWESAHVTEIDGIFFNIVTSTSGANGRRQIAWQTVDIRVYQRRGGKETWAAGFATKDKATSKSYSMQDGESFTLFDGKRLRIHFNDVADNRAFDLDVTFSAAAHNWTGTWSRSGQTFDVVLTRPNPHAGVTPSPFVGDWDGEPARGSRCGAAPGRLYVRESRDGVLSAWLDRTISGTDPKTQSVHNDQRNGERLQVNSVTTTGLILEPPVPPIHTARVSSKLARYSRALGSVNRAVDWMPPIDFEKCLSRTARWGVELRLSPASLNRRRRNRNSVSHSAT